jgi:hypothetical protein
MLLKCFCFISYHRSMQAVELLRRLPGASARENGLMRAISRPGLTFFIVPGAAIPSSECVFLLLQAIELLSRLPEASAREKELLRAVPEMEVVNAMVGNVKLAMPGLSKIKTEARRSKKKGS